MPKLDLEHSNVVLESDKSNLGELDRAATSALKKHFEAMESECFVPKGSPYSHSPWAKPTTTVAANLAYKAAHAPAVIFKHIKVSKGKLKSGTEVSEYDFVVDVDSKVEVPVGYYKHYITQDKFSMYTYPIAKPDNHTYAFGMLVSINDLMFGKFPSQIFNVGQYINITSAEGTNLTVITEANTLLPNHDGTVSVRIKAQSVF